MDERDFGRDLVFSSGALHVTRLSGERRTVSRRCLRGDRSPGEVHPNYAPAWITALWRRTSRWRGRSLTRPEFGWVMRGLEQKARSYAIASVVPEQSRRSGGNRLGWVDRARVAVKERLTRETLSTGTIGPRELRLAENAGKSGMSLNSSGGRRAEELRGQPRGPYEGAGSGGSTPLCLRRS